MKEGWEMKKLGEVCEILDSKRKPITKRDRIPGEIPYYGATGVLSYVKDYLFDEQLVLLGEDGAKWESGDKSAFIINGKTWVNNHAHVLKPKREFLDDDWLVYNLNFQNLMPFISGMTVPKLNQGNMRKIQIPIPPLTEQKQIVNLLDSAFTKIDQAKANIEKNITNAKELFQSKLNEIFSQKGDGWEEKSLIDLCETITDGDHQPPPKSLTGIPFITISNINKKTNKIDFSNTYHVPFDYYDNIKQSRKPIKGDVLYTVTGSFGIPVLINFEMKFCFQRHIGLIRPKNFLKSEFLYYWILSPNCYKQAESLATGTAQKTVSLKSLRSLKITIPSTTIQVDIIKMLSAFSLEINNIEKNYKMKLFDLEELKKSLLQKAFAGELTQLSELG